MDRHSPTVTPQPPAPFRRFVVIPAFNEDEQIAAVVIGLKEAGLTVVVVDDGSSDRTAEIAREAGAEVARHALNMGQGMALRTGIELSLRAGADAIVTFDADGQHQVEDIAALLKPIEDGTADVALGSRFAGTALAIPPIRKLLLRMAAFWYRRVRGMMLTDTHNGLRALSREAARRINITQPRMAHASEILDQIREHQLRYVEVPVTIVYTERSLRKGQSLWGISTVLFDLWLRRLLQ
jgi:glycosyltransferase involved in cell wall biosynthesis